jgi:hypothetical protein
MNKTLKYYRTLATISLFLLFLNSCTPTKLIDAWKDKSYTGGTLKSVMVLGVSNNPRNRKMFEEVFSKQFEGHGVEAVTSFEAIPKDVKLDKENIKSHKEIIKAAAIERGVEAILVTHLVAVEEKEVYHPPTYELSPQYYHGFGDYYTVIFDHVYTPGYYSQHKYISLESNLYDINTEKLIWSASSKTTDPESVNEIIESLCKEVMKSLRKNGLVQ